MHACLLVEYFVKSILKCWAINGKHHLFRINGVDASIVFFIMAEKIELRCVMQGFLQISKQREQRL